MLFGVKLQKAKPLRSINIEFIYTRTELVLVQPNLQLLHHFDWRGINIVFKS